MHEVEQGSWKATFIHLLRMLHAAGGNTIQMLNERLVEYFRNPLQRYQLD